MSNGQGYRVEPFCGNTGATSRSRKAFASIANTSALRSLPSNRLQCM